MAIRYVEIKHPFQPVWDKHSRVLVLGSFPSVSSREAGFYYGHPRNRFWHVLANVFNQPLPESVDSKLTSLHENGVALWDVLAQCDITGSADASIRCAKPNDIAGLLNASSIKCVFANGAKAAALYTKYACCDARIIALPSTSPANASWSLERLSERWQILREESIYWRHETSDRHYY